MEANAHPHVFIDTGLEFIVDDAGRTLVHPRLPEPGLQADAVPLLVNIETLEPDAARTGLFNRMNR